MRTMSHPLYVVVQSGVEIVLAVQTGRSAKEGKELALLVSSVNRSDGIALDVSAVTAMSAGGSALKVTFGRMEVAVRSVKSGASEIEIASAEALLW